MTQSFGLGYRRVIFAALAACLVVGGGSHRPCADLSPYPPCSQDCAPLQLCLASCLLECVSLSELGECDTAVGMMAWERFLVLAQLSRCGCGPHPGSSAVFLTGIDLPVLCESFGSSAARNLFLLTITSLRWGSSTLGDSLEPSPLPSTCCGLAAAFHC